MSADPQKEREPTASDGVPRWTFLTNHAHVLILLAKHPGLVLREVAKRVGITERAVQRIVSDLEQDGFVTRERVGRQNSYRLDLDRVLKHPIEKHKTVGELVALILTGT